MTPSILCFLSCLLLALACAKNTKPQMELTLSLTLPGNPDTVFASEDTLVKSLIGVLKVTDDDPGMEGAVDCTIDDPFVNFVQLNAGFYKLDLGRKLDRETKDKHVVTITCADMGDPSLVETKVFYMIVNDANDNAPTFSTSVYKAEIPENEPHTTEINVRLSVIDLDVGENALYQYHLEDENGLEPELFEINPDDGKIYTLGPLDREEQEEITLFVHVIDFGTPPHNSSAKVVIEVLDLNDNHPIITTEVMHVQEEQSALSEVGKILATDADTGLNGEVVFSMSEKQADSSTIPPFIVHKDGTLVAAVPLDREKRSSYTFYVKATDRGIPSNFNVSAITVVVTDVNDNDPIILWPRQEGDSMGGYYNSTIFIDWYCPSGGRVIARALAMDHDEGENGRLSYFIEYINDEPLGEDSLYQMNPYSGDISLRRCVRETDEPSHLLTLLINDNGIPTRTAMATLNVTLDVDFSSLTSPPPTTTTTPTTPSTVDPSSSTNLVASTLLTYCLLIIVLVQMLHIR